MPKTRRDVDRDRKIEDILAAAERSLLDGGYNALSVPALARELGLAHNAIYWYFPSKDELVVATFERMVHKLFAKKPKSEGLVETVLWFVDHLAELYPLRASMSEQARRSEVLDRYLTALNDRLRTLARHVLEAHVPEAELDVAASTFIATVQGSYLAGMRPKERREMVRFALGKLVGPS